MQLFQTIFALWAMEPKDPGGDRVVRFFREQLKHTKGTFAGQPFEPLPWQDALLRGIFGPLKDGRRTIREAYVECGKKQGKALALDTPIPTPAGFLVMADIEVGDLVFDETGAPTKVVATSEVLTDRPSYLVMFSDGAHCYCDEEHEWVTWSLRAHGYGRYTTREIAATIGNRADGARNHSVDIAGHVACPEADLPIQPYTLGAWLGDGNTANAGFTCHDDDGPTILEHIRSDGYAAIKGKQ